jgi:fructose-1,6-bisphosphatase/inositol monophosphatase family enzyme
MQLEEIDKQVVALCEEVGAFIQRESENFDHSRIEQKTSFNNLVSYVDQEAERKIVSALPRKEPLHNLSKTNTTGSLIRLMALQTFSTVYRYTPSVLD